MCLKANQYASTMNMGGFKPKAWLINFVYNLNHSEIIGIFQSCQ